MSSDSFCTGSPPHRREGHAGQIAAVNCDHADGHPAPRGSIIAGAESRRAATRELSTKGTPALTRPYRHDVVASLHSWRGLRAIVSPGVHQLASLVEQVAAVIGSLRFFADGMRQRLLEDLSSKAGFIPTPGSAAAAKTMRLYRILASVRVPP